MAPYTSVTICRSDGREEYTFRGEKYANCPKDTTKSQDSKSRVYNKLDPDHPKTTIWKAKLGGMLMEQLYGPNHSSKQYALKDLPDGYVLWEHSADSEDVTSDIKKSDQGRTPGSKKGRGDKRTDTYLYGHPEGRTKRFRSPQDFLPHLLWLTLDRDGELNDCTCKLCSPGQKDVERLEEDPVVSKDINVPAVSSAGNEVSLAKSASTPTAIPAPTPGLPRVIRSPEQNLDSEPHGIYLYRPGELVWFNKGAAWGLAVICKRQAINSAPRYLLQPLSHPLRHCSSMIKTQDLIRPWLAWSVPNTTHPQISNLAYDQVPWERVVKGELGSGDAEVDGSILAAKAIDGSYTLFDRLDIPTVVTGEVYYNGMFLGAEKIWVGEPIRMRGASDEVIVMVVQQMIERTAAAASIVTLVGDIYKFVEMPTPYNDRSEWPTPKLPPRMVADLYFRNEVSESTKKGLWYEWRLLEPMARKTLTDVKGRWYETRALLPILRGVEFQNDVAKGLTSDAGVFMNARGDSSNRPGQRKRNRLDTLGRSVPQDLKISRGLNGPAAEDAFPEEHQNIPLTRAPTNLAQFGSSGAAPVSDLDQFMNLDHGTDHQNFYGNTMQH